MSDLISRQAAIDAIRKSASEFSGFMEMEMYTDDDAITAVNTVPSAESVRHGKWIDETFEPWGLVHHPYKCNLCGEHAEFASPYCPNCGSDMRGDNSEHE